MAFTVTTETTYTSDRLADTDITVNGQFVTIVRDPYNSRSYGDPPVGFLELTMEEVAALTVIFAHILTVNTPEEPQP